MKMFDLPLVSAVTFPVMRVMLFLFFFIHFIFVLLLLGTAIINTARLIRIRGGKESDAKWVTRAAKPLIAFKSLAIVWGVGPILLIQVGHSIPFLTAVDLMAPYWLLLIPILIVSLALLETIGHQGVRNPDRALALSIAGTTLLLWVPAIFSAVLTLTENPAAWAEALSVHFGLPNSLIPHWSLRLVHILGAAIVFSAIFLHFFSKEPERKAAMLKLSLNALLIQISIGIALYIWLTKRAESSALFALVSGVVMATVLAFQLVAARRRKDNAQDRVGYAVPSVAFLLLLAMLLTRQFLRDQTLVPLHGELESNSAVIKQELDPYREQGLKFFRTNMDVPFKGPQTHYYRACQYCHGAVANGQGEEAGNLRVKPENLAGIRVERSELRRILREGVPGSAMPMFDFLTGNELNRLMDLLNQMVGILEPVPLRTVDHLRLRVAREVYSNRCALCHGQDGTPLEKFDNPLSPAPPDFKRYTVLEAHADQIIRNGYAGTTMPGFPDLSPDVRQDLVTVIQGFFGRKTEK